MSLAASMTSHATVIGGRYALEAQIGVGGMGVVYRGTDLARGVRVAIKVLHGMHPPDGVAARHMECEARIGRMVRHPNVVAVLDHGQLDGRPYLVMEYVTGRSLRAIAATERISLRRIAVIVSCVLDGARALHRAGFVHGDLKSDNVLVDGDLVKIIDLGLANDSARPDVDVLDHAIAGTPDYIAPELVAGSPKTVASDIYAIGVLLYELLTGSAPFAGGSADQIMHRHVVDAVVPPSRRALVPASLEDVVMRALAKAPAERYPDAAAFAAALDAAACAVDDTECAFDVMIDAPTESCTLSGVVVDRRFAPGTRPPARVRARDVDARISSAVDTASALISEHRLPTAASELEAALAEIADVPATWRLLLPLAALYDRLGDPQRARHTAHLALERAEQTRSEVGRERASALVARLAGRSRSLL